MGMPKGSSAGIQKKNKGDESKVGTWISLAVVGGVILLTYFVLYGLYMARV